MEIETSYRGYDELKYDDICIAMCYFNPIGYKKPLRNAHIVIQELSKYKIPFYIIELLYPNQLQSIPNSFVVRSESILFSKENLWNLIEKQIPSRFKKIIFMDADVFNTDRNWINKTATLLDTNDAIHPMEYIYKDIEDNINQTIKIDLQTAKYSILKAVKNQEEIRLFNHYTGFAVAINRDFFKNIGGIFEYGITGYGDTLFWAAFLKDFEPYCDNFLKSPRFESIRKKYEAYKNRVLSLSSINRITYLRKTHMLHLNHGSHDNRKYPHRNSYVAGIFDLFHNNDGVLEIKIVHPNTDLKQYWLDRQEDS